MASHCGGFSGRSAQAPGAQVSVLAAPGLVSCSTGSVAVGHGLSCSESRGIFLDKGQTVSLELAGEFFTTEPTKVGLIILLKAVESVVKSPLSVLQFVIFVFFFSLSNQARGLLILLISKNQLLVLLSCLIFSVSLILLRFLDLWVVILSKWEKFQCLFL